ncbi:transglutaminase-like domain-containing protein [Roseimaritima ulvae]|uniref:Transglutaminase-like superfamily protein n=1 Tax=Roseimaritima ulvae TaxID=980254 RepID=A0A5B9R271_9BACT|nr:transglutaminase-like domain-containing protein [Roseimaritima ulvae]QEG40331.1 Transglutaminase-like superfamily protein [Roseimaritima ulvae]
MKIAHLGRWAALLAGLFVCSPSLVLAQAPGEADALVADGAGGEPLLRYESPQKQTWRVGLRLETRGANCVNVVATFPIPIDWPEQKVTLVDQQVDGMVSNWGPRDLAGGVRQVRLLMDQAPAGSTIETLLTFEIERSRILGPSPEQIEQLTIPRRATGELRMAMGNSPYINTTDARIKAVAREIAAMEADNDWQRIELVYDWVRDKVSYTEGPLKSASEALRDGTGDCEELTSLFIAICRNLRVPARMVWIPGHCYPEFYLEDAEGNGHWFPCQVAGTRQFGKMDEYRPVLQKGDRFKVPEKKTAQRYVAEFFTCNKLRSNGDPKPTFIRELVE